MANNLLFLIFSFVLSQLAELVAAEKDIFTRTGQGVNLECQSSSTQNVTWSIVLGSTPNTIFICPSDWNDQCEPQEAAYFLSDYIFETTRTNETTILSLLPQRKEQTYQCNHGDNVVHTYNVIMIDPTDIKEYCEARVPSKSGDHEVTLSCGYNCSQSISVNLTFEYLGQNNVEIHRSSQSISGTISFDNFNNIRDAFCKINFPDINVTRNCVYPNIRKTHYIVEGGDVIIECDNGSDVNWHLVDSNGKGEYIKNRSWTREGGRKLLIRRISERDIGKVVVCKTKRSNFSNYGNIIFTVISNLSGNFNKSRFQDSERVPSDQSVFFVPALLFLALWLITTAVGGVWLGCRSKQNKSFNSASGNTAGHDSQLNQSSNARSNLNEGSGERETPLVIAVTGARRNQDNANTNNSAHKAAFELEAETTDDNQLNRQSNNESHLYFTLESSQSLTGSLRRASTSRRDRHGDTNPASLNRPQSSHWQGYEIVGESNKGAACFFDLGEYAEVGDHLVGRGHPDQLVSPPMNRQKPGRKEVKEDISRLYSKVNK